MSVEETILRRERAQADGLRANGSVREGPYAGALQAPTAVAARRLRCGKEALALLGRVASCKGCLERRMGLWLERALGI